jgi:Glycosyltransferase Family 4
VKITIVLGAFFPVPPTMGGGVEKVWFTLAPEFVKRGHEVVIVSRKTPERLREETIDEVKHLRVGGFDMPRSLLWLKFLDLIYSLRTRSILPEADILASDFAARFEARQNLCACRTLSQRTDAFLRQSGAVTGAIAFGRACDRLGSSTAWTQGHSHSISGDKIDPPKDGFAGANNCRFSSGCRRSEKNHPFRRKSASRERRPSFGRGVR